MNNQDHQSITYYAHTKDGEDKSRWQRLIDHLTESSKLAEGFGKDAGIEQLAKAAALIHDLGKYSLEFQRRLEGDKKRVDHSTAGAKALQQHFEGTAQAPLATLLSYCIIGHHTGLPDHGFPTDLPGDSTLSARLNSIPCNFDGYKTELSLDQILLPAQLPTRPLKGHLGFSLAFLTRMIYSTLVDADFQETQNFVQGEQPRGQHASIDDLWNKFENSLKKFSHPIRPIDIKRNETLQSCLQKASAAPGFFSLTVPTGGGKTLSSMAFALRHAKENGLKRIIYVIPFTTIIEQNAKVFKDIFGEENILEHHSNFEWDKLRSASQEHPDNETNSVFSKLKMAAENWDIPIIVTTNVQFFESLFANRSSRCRKLHNIAKSVIIFDEAQMLPRDYMRPALYAIWELVTNYGASSVFCTATQPNLERFLPGNIKPVELAPNPQDLFDFYKRVEVQNIGKITDQALLERLNAQEQVLCIVNTRRHAKGIFAAMTGHDNFHLSTYMCPAHRQQVVKEIRSRLSEHQPCRVVSTTVMEAGVDLDFPVGYRALTGLDSINQAAGRVNREMKNGVQQLFVFEPDSEFIKRTPKYISQITEVTRMVLRDYPDQPISTQAIQAYFERLYSLKNDQDFDFKNILGCFDKSQPTLFDFADAAKKFRIIEDETISVLIPYTQEASRLIEELKFTPFPSSTLRKLQPFTASLYEQEFDALNLKGAIDMILDRYPALINLDFYDQKTGLVVPEASGGDAMFG